MQNSRDVSWLSLSASARNQMTDRVLVSTPDLEKRAAASFPVKKPSPSVSYCRLTLIFIFMHFFHPNLNEEIIILLVVLRRDRVVELRVLDQGKLRNTEIYALNMKAREK